MANRTLFDPAILPRLGKVPDAQLASELGCSVSAVHGWRTQRGIAAFQPHQVEAHDDATEEEIERIIAEQMQCLPAWRNDAFERDNGDEAFGFGLSDIRSLARGKQC